MAVRVLSVSQRNLCCFMLGYAFQLCNGKHNIITPDVTFVSRHDINIVSLHNIISIYGLFYFRMVSTSHYAISLTSMPA